MLEIDWEKLVLSRAISHSTLSRLQPRRASKLIKLERGSLQEMQSNLPQLGSPIKTQISLGTRLLHLLFSQCLTRHQRLRRLGPTITLQAQPSLSRMLVRELLLQGPLSTARMPSGRVLFLAAQPITFQPENASLRKALVIKACGVMIRSSGRRRSHSLLWWARSRKPDHLNSTREPLTRERPRSSMEKDTGLASLHSCQRRRLDKVWPMCSMTSQKIPDTRERDRTFNLVFWLTKMRMSKDLEKEITQMLGQEFNQHRMSDGIPTPDMQSQTILVRLIHIRAGNNN